MLALVCTPLLATTVAHADNLDFSLVNKTGYVISEIYVSSASTSDWEDDVMGSDVLGKNESVDIEFEKGSKGCKWDMKVVYDDGEEAVWENLNLCSISKVSLRYDRKKGDTWAELK
ncbi:hypothetical protein SDC9_199929 [bioreactor metagenome]|uniref:Argininosuccinate lyase n=1 Tax=bioreactor metagenome TaxID=1076179 RepID=A0A645IYH7_9ZZZZ